MELVVKDNALINASYTLSLVEQRLVLLAIIEARETSTGVDSETFVEIHAQRYADHFNISVKNVYQMLSEAAQTLFNRQVTYFLIDEKRNKPEKRVVRWVSGISYVEGAGVMKLRFAPEIIPLITQLEKNFTSYELSQVANLGLYATRLYELLISWRTTGKTPTFEINEFRLKIGVEAHEYKAMGDFKKRVLEPAIKQINQHTDISSKYEQYKSGRIITGFSFAFTEKSKKAKHGSNLQTVDMFAPSTEIEFFKMSESQLDTFSGKLSSLHDIQKIAHTGEDMKSFTARLRSILLDPKKQKTLLPYLEQVGFKIKH